MPKQPSACPECDSLDVVQTSSWKLWRCYHCGAWYDEDDYISQRPAARRKPRHSDDDDDLDYDEY